MVTGIAALSPLNSRMRRVSTWRPTFREFSHDMKREKDAMIESEKASPAAGGGPATPTSRLVTATAFR
jgi:hypothetical protein